jgi:hypothetical protein
MSCIEGELVWMVAPCPLSLRYPNGPCSCGRTFRGMYSDGQTTTAVVREVDGLTREAVRCRDVRCRDYRVRSSIASPISDRFWIAANANCAEAFVETRSASSTGALTIGGSTRRMCRAASG